MNKFSDQMFVSVWDKLNSNDFSNISFLDSKGFLISSGDRYVHSTTKKNRREAPV